MSVRYAIPKRVTLWNTLNFINKIWGETPFGEKIEIDFSGLEFVYPVGTTYLAYELRDILNSPFYESELVGIDAEKNSVHSYLDYVGFWEILKIQINQFGEALGSTSYIPLTKIDFSNFDTNNRVKFRELHESIDEKSRQMASIITGEHRPYINQQLTYSLREAIRNVAEHGETDSCLVYGQKWKTGELEIAIADKGCGIIESMSSAFSDKNEVELFNLSIQPGVSSKLSKFDEEDKWSNAGFGLYVLSELGKRFGNFLLMSGNIAFFSYSSGKIGTLTIPSFRGTIVGLKLRQISHKDFKTVMREIVAEGESKLSEEMKQKIRSSKSTTSF